MSPKSYYYFTIWKFDILTNWPDVAEEADVGDLNHPEKPSGLKKLLLELSFLSDAVSAFVRDSEDPGAAEASSAVFVKN